MQAHDVALLRDLLTARRVLALAVVAGGEPVLGMVPFVAEADLSAVLIHVSQLAPHGRALASGAPFAVLIHGLDTPDVSPGEIPRVRLSGRAERVASDSPGYAAARAAYLARFPESALTFGLADFELYRLPFEGGRLIAGFARTVDLRPETLRRAAGGPAAPDGPP